MTRSWTVKAHTRRRPVKGRKQPPKTVKGAIKKLSFIYAACLRWYVARYSGNLVGRKP